MPNHLAYKLPISALDVVVIDNNQFICQSLQTALAGFGVSRIRLFSNGESALRVLADEPPNLVITDLHLKPANGCQVVRAMRHERSKSLCLVPVIMMLGRASRYYVQKSFVAGAHQVLIKPVTPDVLLKRIKWILQDERELILKNRFYVCSENPCGQNGKAVQNKTKSRILHEAIKAGQSAAPKAVNPPPKAANKEKPVPVPAQTGQAGEDGKDLWEI